MTPGDILITLRTCGDLRRGDVVTVSHTSPSGEYVYLDEQDGKISSRADAFMLAVKRPWHAWADPEWERRAREAAERFVRDGLPAAMLLGMSVRVDPSLPREVEFMLESPAPVATCRACRLWRNFVGPCPVGMTMPDAPGCRSFAAVSEPYETRTANGHQWTRMGWTTWWVCDACGYETQDPSDDDTTGIHSCAVTAPAPAATEAERDFNVHLIPEAMKAAIRTQAIREAADHFATEWSRYYVKDVVDALRALAEKETSR